MDNKNRSIVEEYLEGRLHHMNFNDAVKQVNEKLGDLIDDMDEILQAIVREREEQVTAFTKLTEVGISRRQDLREVGWYTGVEGDGVWSALKELMENGGLGKALTSIDASSDEIVATLAEPKVDGDKRLGLVVGNVQSGKTANYSAVIAKALDSKYQLVLVLSGVHNNLRKQTQQRLDRDLGVIENSRDWYQLTSDEADFGTACITNASAIARNNKRILAVVKKNGSRLRNLLNFLRAVDEETKKRLPILIVDDESDQATPDSSPDKDSDPTAINQLMREIWAEVRNGTYVGYTATPFANIFMDPNSQQGSKLEELYPKDFLHVMPTPAEYFGAERIFGLGEVADEKTDVPDVVRTIPQDEVEILVPKGKGADLSSQVVTRSLGEAIRWFVVASAVRRVRGQTEKHSTMLIHTTHKTEPHFAMREAVEEFLEPIRQLALNDDVESFREVFTKEMSRAGHLFHGDASTSTWKHVSREIPAVLHSLRVAVDNSKAEDFERLSYPDDQPQTVIVIGGGTLSRGLTLEGLFVSYFCRTSNTYDTLLQMGRWFGYRKGYEDLQRIWLSPGLDLDYRFLASVESDLRNDMELMTRLGQTPAEIGVRVRQHPGRLQITNPSKMKHTDRVAVDFEGSRMQTTLFDVSDEDVLRTNARTTESLINRISPYQLSPERQLFRDVPLEELTEFFNDFTVHERFREPFADAVKWAADKLPDTPWNVVIASGKGVDFITGNGVKIGSIQRAPIQKPDEEVNAEAINIRALMSGEDIVSDIRLDGRLKSLKDERGSSRLSNKAQYDLRKASDGADGRGLLVVYPVSRFSKPDPDSKERMPMDDALRAVDEKLVDDGLPPMLGIAVIAPFDSAGKVKDKGTFIAVQPIFNDHEEPVVELTVDAEKDFEGDPR
ncbi:Z1 domain-containing protein [Brevibacterium sp. W7.2]|uniref:Z1 domain-containing protein n=1 Tax=Brevibacterium sp. W7.2 TaxID=2823518 RepID=UPI001BAD2EE1|nr:Z1 domain-containing protein [Brevibacterium sp. W7.2]